MPETLSGTLNFDKKSFLPALLIINFRGGFDFQLVRDSIFVQRMSKFGPIGSRYYAAIALASGE